MSLDILLVVVQMETSGMDDIRIPLLTLQPVGGRHDIPDQMNVVRPEKLAETMMMMTVMVIYNALLNLQISKLVVKTKLTGV